MRAIITGGNGFIGSWLTEELLKNGYYVVLIVRNRKKVISEIKNFSRCSIIEKDLKDLDVKDFDLNCNYDVFYNLSWDGVAPEDKNDVEKQLNNIPIAVKMLSICKNINCKLFVSSGTVAEYALTTDVMNLESKQSPNDMYGAAKVSVHHFLNVRSRQIDQNFIWCVIPSTFGERRTTNNIITYTIKTLLNGEKPKYGNLLQMWDFLYVSEVARALRYIGEKGIPGKVYGIGSGQYRLLRDYICIIRDQINPSLELGIGEAPEQSERTFSSCVNIYDLIKDTGFRPEISFQEGIKKTIDYYLNNN